MNPSMPDLPSLPDQQARARDGARRAAGVVTLLAFGFVANALLSGPQAEPPLANPAAVAPPPATPAQTPRAVDAAAGEVMIQPWIWETAATDQRPATRQDLEELWLPR